MQTSGPIQRSQVTKNPWTSLSVLGPSSLTPNHSVGQPKEATIKPLTMQQIGELNIFPNEIVYSDSAHLFLDGSSHCRSISIPTKAASYLSPCYAPCNNLSASKRRIHIHNVDSLNLIGQAHLPRAGRVVAWRPDTAPLKRKLNTTTPAPRPSYLRAEEQSLLNVTGMSLMS